MLHNVILYIHFEELFIVKDKTLLKSNVFSMQHCDKTTMFQYI